MRGGSKFPTHPASSVPKLSSLSLLPSLLFSLGLRENLFSFQYGPWGLLANSMGTTFPKKARAATAILIADNVGGPNVPSWV